MINVGKLIQSEIARARHDAEVQMTQNLNQIAQAMSEEFRKVQYELSEVRSNTVTECKSKGDQTDDATEDGHMPELGASDTELELLDGFRRVDHDADSVGSDSGPNAEMLDRLIIDLVPCNLRVEPATQSEPQEEELDIMAKNGKTRARGGKKLSKKRRRGKARKQHSLDPRWVSTVSDSNGEGFPDLEEDMTKQTLVTIEADGDRVQSDEGGRRYGPSLIGTTYWLVTILGIISLGWVMSPLKFVFGLGGEGPFDYIRAVSGTR